MYDKHTLLKEAEMKVIDFFLDLKPHYFNEIVNQTKMTKPRTLKVLRKLKANQILTTQTQANAIYYHLNKKTPLTSLTLSLVKYHQSLNFLERKKTLSRALNLFKENSPNYLVLLIFGSYAKKTQTKESDIDLLILVNSFSKKDIKEVEELAELVYNRTGLNLAPYLMTLKEFKQKNKFTQEVIDHNLLLEGGELFFKVIL